MELSSSLNDGMANAKYEGQRRMLECMPFPRHADLPICVAAWHGVLHWLRYNDEPVMTCLLGAQPEKCWPLVTAISEHTSLGELLADVKQQWVDNESDWFDLHDPNHPGLADQLRCHAICLHGVSEEASETEFMIVRDCEAWFVDCDASRFSASYQRFVMAMWAHLVTRMLESPASRLSAENRFEGLDAYAPSQTDMSGPAKSIAGNLPGRFAASVAAHPHKIAVVDADGSLSFAELDALSERWAQALHTAGVIRGDYVGVAFGRSHRMVAAQLATLKVGAVFVPLDATQPATRLQAMADDAEMRVALTETSWVSSMREALPAVLCLDVASSAAAVVTDTDLHRPQLLDVLSTDDLAYVIFTSGSTGRPKGVKVSHGNLLNFVTHLKELMSADEIVSQFAPVTFDASVGEIHSALLNGATLVILPAELIDSPDRLQAYMSEQRVTFAAFPPQYAKHLWPEKLPQLKTLLTAGSAPDHELVRRWQPHLQYVNAYGPTETTILSTLWQASHQIEQQERLTIGFPIINTEVRVVNRFNQPLPRGAIGELLIGGAGVTHGYLKREEMTRDKFITADRMRWYRSGDLSCFDDQNRLFFAGRVDNQIKLRGHRLEPGEVETALLTLPGIEHAAVIVTEVQGAKQLVVFCVGKPQPEETIRTGLGQVLPAWAMPNRILWLSELPLTVNGKTDYRALQARLLQNDAPSRSADHADQLEAQIADIWRGVLQQPDISREDNFIHLGGDSLTALVVMSALKRLGYQITSSQLLSHPRLADFAELLRHSERRLQRDYASRQGIAPLSPIQGWFFQLQLARPGAFCQTLSFETEEDLDAERLHRAFSGLAVYHDQLRAHFVRTGTVAQEAFPWRQEIASAALALPAIPSIEVAEAELEQASEQWRTTLAAQLHIEQAPLFRIVLLKTASRSRVLWVLHHLLVDTISHGVLLDDLRHLYVSDGNDLEAILPGKSISYLDWSEKFSAHLAEKQGALLDDWLPVLRAVESAQALPLAKREAGRSSITIGQHHLSRQDTARLTGQAAACYRQSAEELLLAATYLALARSCKLERICLDVEWHGRDEAFAGPQGLDRTVGWFTSVHPLCLTVPAQQDLGDWLVQLKECRAAIPQRGRDFYALRYLSRDPAVREQFERYRSPQVLFNFSGVVQRSHQSWRTVPMAAIEMGEGNASPYALSVESEIRDGELIVSLYFDPAAWPDGLADKLGETLIQCLREVIDHCVVDANRRWTPSDFPVAALTQAQADALPATVKAVYPLTDMQRTMHRHKDTYQVHMCYRMPRRLDWPAWQLAVADWIGRHDCLRTVIKEWDSERGGGEIHQVVLTSVAAETRMHQAPPGQGAAFAQQLIEQARGKPVQLSQAPLFDLQAVDEAGDSFLTVLSIHHIIHDGWSIELLLNDLLRSYRHFLGEDESRPSAPLAGMADIVEQQRRLLASETWRAYWLALPWERSASQLPCAAPLNGHAAARPDTRIYLGSIERDLAADVRARAGVLGVTANSLWLTAYACLLRYLGGQAQVRCGVIQSGRMEEIPGFDTITGCCVNTLPLVLNIDSTSTPAGLLASVNAQLDAMRACAAFPLSHIHETVKPRLDDELFNSLFNIESQRYGEQHAQLRPVLESGYESTNYRFIFGLIEQDCGIDETGPAAVAPRYGVRIGYDASLYDEATVAMWLEIYAHCVRQLIDQTDAAWSELRLLPPALRRQSLSAWNQTDHAYSADRCMHELFAEQAARTPYAEALVCEEERLSYRELDQRSNRLAQHLCSLGVGPDVVVGLCVERSTQMVVGMLGILKAGGAYVPLDPELPPQRLAAMVTDIGLNLVLTQAPLAAGPLSQVDAAVRLLRLDAEGAQMAQYPAVAPATGVTPGHLIYVIFTSGSTGKPKAAMNQHGALVNYIQCLQASHGLDASDRVLQKTPFSFDVSAREIFWPLLAGATLVMARPGGHRDPAYLSQAVRGHGITTLSFVPSMLQVFADHGELHACTSLRRMFVSGEALPGALAARFLSLSKARLYNLYGPTEAAVDVSGHEVKSADGAIVPIGRPLWNTRLYVLDEHLEPVPTGVGGELYVGGVAVGRGYLGRDDLTAERFIDSPFEPGERLYRTGDLARWRADGEVEYLGRLDHQVKIRGFRIELGEIEHALSAHENVRQALVIARADGGHQQLVAYLVAKDLALEDDRAASQLIQSCREKLQAALPEYMVPAAFVLLEALPCNANGKADRAGLPEPGPSAYVHTAYAEPGNDCERKLRAIWSEVLQAASFGVTDNFFAIGGDSILAIQVVARAARQGIVLTPRLIIEEKTIRNLATRLAQKEDVAAVAEPAHEREAIKGEQRLLPIQIGFLQGDGVDVDHYCQYAAVSLPRQANLELLKTALAAIVARHDVLRLKFRQTAAGWIAQYRPELLSDVAGVFDEMIVEADAQDTAGNSADPRSRIRAEVERAQAGLDIRQGKLCRWVWLRDGDQSQLIWIMHHLIVDVVSWQVLQDDLNMALEHACRGEPVRLAAASSSYQEWAARLHDYAYSAPLEREKAYWLKQLEAPAAVLAYDRDAAQQEPGGLDFPVQETTEQVVVGLSREETALLLGRAGTFFEVRTHQLLIAALSRTLGDWLDADDIRIDLESHGRDDMAGEAAFEGLDLSQTVGWFTALYPIHVVGVRAGLAEHVRATGRQLEAVPRNGIGYGLLASLAHDEDLMAAGATLGGHTSEVLFNYLGQVDPDVRGGSFVSPRRARTHALNINGMISAGALTLHIDYSRRQFRRETMEAVAARLVGVLQDMLTCDSGGPGPDSGLGRESSQFPLAAIGPADLSALQAKYPALQDLYPCTGMQQGLLLLADRASKDGLYLTQLRMQLEAVDPARLRQSWQELVKRNPVLRTAFVDIGQDELLQMVMAEVDLPWRELDLRTAVSTDSPNRAGDLQQVLEQLLADERSKSFDLGAAPLMRLLLVRTGERQHCLAWTHHHALIDGWSMGLLVKQLFQIYSAPQAQALPAPEYKNYIAWLQSQDRKTALRYWSAYFDGLALAASASLPLETEAEGRVDAGQAGSQEQKAHSIELSADATTQLRQLAQAEGVSLGTLILAAWGLLQSKYSGEPEVLFGYTTSGRPAALDGIETMVGLFINSLPIRLKIVADQSLSSWLQEIQRIQLDHEDHGFLPLADIQRCSGSRLGQSLFNALVVVENFPLDRALLSADAADGLRMVDVQGVERSDLGLSLIVYPGERLTLKLAYQSTQFDAAPTLQLLQRLNELLASFAKGGAQPLSQLSVLSEAERQRAVRDWNATDAAYPLDRCVHQLFQIQADTRANEIAVVAGTERWSYRQLAERAQAIASWLTQSGVEPGERVALSLGKEPYLIAAMLGIMRAGAAYVPMALDCPPERGSFMAEDAGIKRLVTRRGHQEQADGWGVAPLFLEDCLQDGHPGISAQQDGSALPAPASYSTAYVIYTSGTTGKPKGVLVSHRNLVNFCCWFGQTGLSRAGEGFSQFAPHTFDASAGEIFGALLNGAELHLLSDELIQEPRALAQYFTGQRIRFAAFPPPYLQQMDPDLVPEGMSLLTAGSAPTPELVQRWSKHCRYVNGYGPTETTILSSAWMGEGDNFDGKLSIGRPIANTTMYVVDSVGQLCAPGLLGEIWIGGEGVAQGYLNRPDLSAQQFIADPWRPGSRVYRTGDLGRWLNDGRIECVGRRDRQVKLRGFRIELNEIENRIREYPAIQDVAVLVRGDEDDKRLFAWVVQRNETTTATAEPAETARFLALLRDFLRRSLPEYMVPQYIVPLDQLPLTANGKLDDKALPQPDVGAGFEAAYVAPRTANETVLTEIWASVLKLQPEQISATANFFELGGHSLLAMRAVTRLREQLGVDLGVVDLLANPVLADLAALVENAGSHALPPIAPVDRNGGLPLSLAQQRLWLLSQMPGVSETYHVPGVLRLQGRLDHKALRRALDRIVERHEVLRTCFRLAGGEPYQHIDAAGQGFALIEHDLSHAADAEQRLPALIKEEAGAGFDLASGPLLRGRLIVLDAEEHVLLLTQHHIITDAWSLALMVRELSIIYNAYLMGAEDPLPALTVQYADYAAWQRQSLGGSWLQAQSGYWHANLAGAPALLELPTDWPRPAQQKYDGDVVAFTLDAELTTALKELSRRHDTTLFVTLLTGWAIVLSRLSGQQDVVIGSPVANRMQAALEPMIGFFVNTLALRIDLSGEPAVGELLQRVRQQTLAAQRHQQMPFEQVVEVVQPPRSLAHAPIFQVMFNWLSENVADAINLDGLQILPQSAPRVLSKFDLTLDLAEAGDCISGVLEYATALFERQTIERWSGYLERALRAMVEQEQQCVRQVDLIGAEEKRRLLSFNDTCRPDLIDRTWPELFAAQALRTPERIAVQCETAQLSYGELHQRTSRLATALRRQGVAPGQTVALLDHRGTDLLVMIIAVLKAGAAYLPIDPTHPTLRWLDILHEAQPCLLVVGDTLAEPRSWLEEHWQADKLRSTAGLLAVASTAEELLPPSLDDLAYLLFTSGSTGKPKGVMIEHRGMVNNMRSKVAPLAMSADDVIAQTAPQCFDISVWQFLTGLLLGAKVYIVANDVTRDPQALLECLDRQGVTIWEPVPSLIQAALPYRRPLPHLRWVISVGEALPRELVERWFEQYPDLPLMNHYGPAECSDDVTFHPIHAPVERVLIGAAMPNAQMHLVDDQLRLLPLGVVGEIAVSGAVVGRGYLNRNEETQAKFRRNPYARHATEERLYLTGDLGRRFADGTVEYIGRKDFQVKIRGFRIELGEIESGLARHPSVREAVVVASETARGDKQLVAYVTLKTAVSAEQIKAHLRASLPDYMIPAAVVLLDALPLNGNGKVDRKALLALEIKAEADTYHAPRGSLEMTLAQIWQELLQIERVSRDDGFFDLGGHSLLAARMVGRLRQELKIEVNIADLFAFPVFADFARVLVNAVDSDNPAIVPTDRNGPLPLSFAQQRLWFLSQMQGSSETYHLPGMLDLQGKLDRAALYRALDRIVARHEVLRTRFALIGGEPHQSIAAADHGFRLTEHDLSAPADAWRLQPLIEEEMHTPFDLAGCPPVRGRLLVLGADRHILLVTLHHIVTDAWSQGLLIHELGVLYNAYRSGAADPLPPLAVQYADYAVWQRQCLAGVWLQEQVDYWRDTLNGAPTLLELPTDRPRPAQQVYDGGYVPVVLDAEFTAALKSFSRDRGATLFMTLLTGWAIVLSRLSGQQDLVIGSPVANRTQVEVESLIGFFVNMLALRIDLSGDLTVADLLERVKQQTLGAQRHQQIPFEHVVEAVQPPRGLAHTPVFQVMFNWLSGDVAGAAGAVELDGLRIAPQPIAYRPSKFDLSLDLAEIDGCITGGLEYATALFDHGTVERWLGYFKHALRAMADEQGQQVRQLDVLGAQEARWLSACNDTYRPELIERSWPELFSAQALRTPDRIAVQCEARQLTYRELHELTSRLAATLRERGIGGGQAVALLDQRGTDLLVMIIAVLKAGGAYLPLDPSHPTQRWLEIIQEAQPGLVVVGDQLAVQRAWLDGHWLADKVVSTVELVAAATTATPALDLAPPAPGDLAYLLFTSGSTGKPKGVMIEHSGMINNIRAKHELLSMSSDDVIAQTAPQCFDISVWQFLTGLLLGAKVYVVASDVARDPEALLACLHRQAVTIWEPVPSLIQAVLQHVRSLPHLRWVISVGEALPRELVARWFERYPDLPLMNHYGPAECSDGVTFHPIYAPVERVMIGTPIANAQMHLVDDLLQRVPLGAVGEIAVAGPAVGRGYINRPEETQSKFRPNPYARHAAEQRLYLTGDLGRRWPDGQVEYIGRKDFQVKIRGFRIELGEIESSLLNHPGVREAVVVACELGTGNTQLAAYVTLKGVVAVDELKVHLRMTLPDYMIPAAIMALDVFPLNGNGKVDRKALPALAASAFQQAIYEAPEGAAERLIAAVWQELLNVPQVGRGDNFFDLGGSSILLVRMLGRLREQGLSLSVTDVYQQRTLRTLGAASSLNDLGLDDWLQSRGWRCKNMALDAVGGKVAVLLVEQADSSRAGELKDKLSKMGSEGRPDFIRICENLESAASRFESQGIGALGLPPVEQLPAAHETQFASYLEAIAAAPREDAFPFSALQRGMLAWAERGSSGMIEIAGWHTAQELQDAFGRLVQEQELLRAVPDHDRRQWSLLAAEAVASAAIAHIDLKSAGEEQLNRHLAAFGDILHHARKRTPLAYTALWVSASDTRHVLLLALDHLIWDGMSQSSAQRRLTELLKHKPRSIERTYRDYLGDVQRKCDLAARDFADQLLDYAELSAVMPATRAALEARRSQPLQILGFEVALDAACTGEQLAFDMFKHWITQATGLARVGTVLIHHGRELGEHNYFDQLGLFLDKIPFVVAADTSLAEMSAKAACLQKQGLHYASLDDAASVERAAVLPGLAQEILFNFQTEAPSPQASMDTAYLRNKLQDYYGLLFEAYVADGKLSVHCVFRGSEAEIDSFRQAYAAVCQPAVDGAQHGAQVAGDNTTDIGNL
ncbi:Siderophore biosynthesis non-ribosomal peptide synthetase modules [Collimonas arenae]|uniref:Siderophore biosynthesis non-ribosomal peptide synthetase modules n=2 Tax=Collimonas arenae TaxID=279058 RepID=A0A0A1F8H1_9BURK|nr:Siderophore biosynthesis non-ribosomal peptide synthetase modules [Collimonas arenae]